MPERFGIRTSIRITSGISSWAFATTSTPSDASPTSSRSASWSRTIWSPRRNSAWSSQTRTRSFSVCSAAFSLMPAPFPWRYPASSLASGVAVVRLPGFYATRTPDQARSLLLVVVPDLAFELLHQHVERGLDVAGVRAGPIALARCRPPGRVDRRPRAASRPLPARAPPPRQDLHLNRAMLTDQGSAYVGRFARGWHRLPRNLSPGQPQTRTRAHRRV